LLPVTVKKGHKSGLEAKQHFSLKRKMHIALNVENVKSLWGMRPPSAAQQSDLLRNEMFSRYIISCRLCGVCRMRT
jgi:hypothetical protein